MKIKKTIVRILSVFLILMLMPVTSFATEWHGADIPEGETATLTHNMGYRGSSTIRGELIVDGCELSLGLQPNDTLAVFGKITIKNGSSLFNQIPLYNTGLITVETDGTLKNNCDDKNQHCTIYNEGVILIQRGATFVKGNTSGSGVIGDLNENRNIMSGAIGPENYDSTVGYSYVYFGNNQSYTDGNMGKGPIKWRVLDADKGNATGDVAGQSDILKHGQTAVANNDAMLMLSDSSIDETVVSDNGNT